MNNKKNFNNLFDSVMVLLLLLILIISYVLIMVFGLLNDNFNKNAICICSSIVFIPSITVCSVLLVIGCFEFWSITGRTIYSKKLFKKIVIINLDDISSITEEVVPAIILGIYKTNAIVVKSSTKKIVIYLNKKITSQNIRNMLNLKNEDN